MKSKKNRILTICRGISGAGKSTYIKDILKVDESLICSADHFFMQNGKYSFNPKLLGKAHAASKEKCNSLCRAGKYKVVVDNTCTRWNFECKPYTDLAEKYGYEVEVIRLTCNPETAAKRNSHGVPLASIQKMQERFEDHEGETIIDTTNGYRIIS